eukprot:CAMPEP_0201516316 /NCGR_PEP_ID=MMETSP0161_2-20130828/7675_1 /ASSEMBLY_ACC=CAM_ASM_000251 /TAXON_ID=180227 /ORGANISM="Neoparamoeba aestuarina, Strain SoJaBio B1-5/56/2" /LENGTH=134 /DNA_ID=CAMNT_0047913399 /DNA_START=201 /DNA_END=605 /DNA_ORIENTATION=+
MSDKMKGISNPLRKTEFTLLCHKSNKNLSGAGSKCLLMVERKAILIMDAKKTQIILRTPYQDILTWTTSNETFAFDFLDKKKKDENIRYLFMTKEGVQISDAIKCRVEDILDEEKKKYDPEVLEKLGFTMPAEF